MVTAMKTVASLDVELTVEERNLLSVAYKNVIGARRASWRIISSIEQKEENKAAEDKLKMIKAYRSQVQTILLLFFRYVFIWSSSSLVWSPPRYLCERCCHTSISRVFWAEISILFLELRFDLGFIGLVFKSHFHQI